MGDVHAVLQPTPQLLRRLAEVGDPPARSGSVDVDPEVHQVRDPTGTSGGVWLPQGGRRGRRPSKTVLGAEEFGGRGRRKQTLAGSPSQSADQTRFYMWVRGTVPR